jgi:CBS domain-containing protein
MAAKESTPPLSEIGRICRRNVTSVGPDVDIGSAARLMREKHIGYLIVTEPGAAEPGDERVVGVITDRDIVVAVVAREVEPRSLKVGDVMTRNPLLVGEDICLDAVLSFMRDAGVRRVPVVGPHGDLRGVLSMDDVLERMAQQLANIAGSFRSEQRTEAALRP